MSDGKKRSSERLAGRTRKSYSPEPDDHAGDSLFGTSKRNVFSAVSKDLIWEQSEIVPDRIDDRWRMDKWKNPLLLALGGCKGKGGRGSFEFDHIKSCNSGGTNIPANGQILLTRLNRKKSYNDDNKDGDVDSLSEPLDDTEMDELEIAHFADIARPDGTCKCVCLTCAEADCYREWIKIYGDRSSIIANPII